eukprot:TRINITY_DN19421_c0_g1_i2.p1 TRINITY_DN19421_c0_g1~~TRINITY_DN19421_c0_g1_i2.p1  ORF type:complete len:541 (+),score=46.39 TRINITY_DN19421_c0_g1_i2:80-1624(+)
MSTSQELSEENTKPAHRMSDYRMLVLMPFMCFFLSASPYAEAPLHYSEHDWALWQMGALQFASYALRNAVGVTITCVGRWMAPLFCLLALLCVLPSCVWPDTEWAVNLGLLAVWATNLELAWQAVAFAAYSHSEPLLKRASRIQTLSSTVGYAVSPFICGLVYDFLGGWSSITLLQAVGFAYMALTYATHPVIVEDWHRWKSERSYALKELPEKSVVGEGRSPACNIHPSCAAEDTECAVPSPKKVAQPWEADEVEKRNTSAVSPDSEDQVALKSVLTLPMVAMAFAHFANQWTYHTEWATFAVYFQEQHHWNNACLAGFTQMIGDVVGGALLVSLTLRRPTNAGRETTREQTTAPRGAAKSKRALLPGAVFGQPYNLSWLLLGWIVTSLGLASSSLAVAISSQVVMGTLSVFFLQTVNEMSMLYSFGCGKRYVKLQTCMQFGWATGCAVAGVVALSIADYVDRIMPYYISAGLCAVAFVFYTAVFLLRVGCPSSLAELENERRRHITAPPARL